FFIEGNLTMDNYLVMLRDEIVPVIRNIVNQNFNDIEKAFDHVLYTKLIELLFQARVDEKDVRLRGIWIGCLTSPTLYNTFDESSSIDRLPPLLGNECVSKLL
ncbi:hypothetical protein ALC56_03958, partial [Trachymyrmex septentrionalis]